LVSNTRGRDRGQKVKAEIKGEPETWIQLKHTIERISKIPASSEKGKEKRIVSLGLRKKKEKGRVLTCYPPTISSREVDGKKEQGGRRVWGKGRGIGGSVNPCPDILIGSRRH